MVTVFWGILILCTPMFASAGATGAGGSVCPSVVYLKNGIGGQIPCLCGPFTIVAWYREEEFNGGGSPIINYDKVQKRGQGFSSGEYDIAENGSLVITNVTRNHDGVFVVTVADDSQHREDQIRIRVIVVVPAVPVYPVVNGKVNQQHVYLGVNRKGVLTCAMSDVYPAFNLTFKSHSDKIKFEHQNMSKMLQQNNKYDVTLSTIYTVTDLSIERLTIFCEVADDEIADQFADKTTAILVLEPVYPVVNGYTNQEHVYLDKIDRVGQLNCMKKKVPVGTSLTWEVADSSLQGRVSIESFPAMSDNNDGTVDITQMINYTVDNSVNRILLLCKVGQPDTEQLLATKVDLLFENVYPVVNGFINQRHVYLDANREGHLTCMKENVAAGTTLAWKIVDPNMQEKITFQSNAIVLDNNDGTVTINQEVGYRILDHSLDRVTIECEVTTPDTDEKSLATKVELLFQNVYPVVNGYVNQNRVYLDVDRIGHLSCLKENVDPDTRLEWALDSTLKGKVTFHSRAVTVINPDGTVNINQTFDYIVHDNFLERVTIECRVIKPGILEQPITTTVDLLFSSDPVITGCYDSPHNCVLEVQRSGELTCTVKKSHYPVTLKWTTSDTDKTHVALKNSTITAYNSSNLYNVRITTQYTVEDETVTIVTVKCDACIAESGQVMATAETSLMIQTAGDTIYHPSTGYIIGSMLMLVVIILLLFIVLFLYFKMYKNLLVKFKHLTVDRPTDNGQVEMAVTRCTNCAERGSLLNSGNCVANGVQVQNNQSDSPDSGNSHSNSQQLNEDESSEQHAFLDDGWLDSKKQDPSDVNLRAIAFGDAQVV